MDDLSAAIEHYEGKLKAMLEEQDIYVEGHEFLEASYFSDSIQALQNKVYILRELKDPSASKKERLLKQIDQLGARMHEDMGDKRSEFYSNKVDELLERLGEMNRKSKRHRVDGQLLFDNLLGLLSGESTLIKLNLYRYRGRYLQFSKAGQQLKVLLSSDHPESHQHHFNKREILGLADLGMPEKTGGEFERYYPMDVNSLDKIVVLCSGIIYDVLQMDVDKNCTLEVTLNPDGN